MAAQISSVLTQQHLVDVLLRQPEGLLADAAHGHAVREDADALERHALPGAQRIVHARGVFRLDADDAHQRIERLDVGRDAGDQPTAADRDEDRIGRRRHLAQDFHADRALPGDDVGVVERMDERQLALRCDDQRVLVGVVEVVAVQHYVAAEVEHGLDLDVRRGLRHHDHRGDAPALRGQRDALRVVARRRADHAALRRLIVEVRDLVVGPAQLEREDRLQVLALEEDGIAEPPAEAWRGLERGFDGDVVYARLEDAFDVTFLHGNRLAYRRVRYHFRPWIPFFPVAPCSAR